MKNSEVNVWDNEMIYKHSCLFVLLVVFTAINFQLVSGIADTNLSNNVKQVYVNITNTSNYDLQFVRLVTPGKNFNDFDAIVPEHVSFINSTFPISEEELTFVKGAENFDSILRERPSIGNSSRNGSDRVSDLLNVLNDRKVFESDVSTYERVVYLLPDGALVDYFNYSAVGVSI